MSNLAIVGGTPLEVGLPPRERERLVAQRRRVRVRADTPRSRNGGSLNNLDFRLLHINIAAPTAKEITKLPEVLTHNRFWTDADVTTRRTVGS